MPSSIMPEKCFGAALMNSNRTNFGRSSSRIYSALSMPRWLLYPISGSLEAALWFKFRRFPEIILFRADPPMLQPNMVWWAGAARYSTNCEMKESAFRWFIPALLHLRGLLEWMLRKSLALSWESWRLLRGLTSAKSKCGPCEFLDPDGTPAAVTG